MAFAVRANVSYDGNVDDDGPVTNMTLSFEVKDYLHIKEVGWLGFIATWITRALCHARCYVPVRSKIGVTWFWVSSHPFFCILLRSYQLAREKDNPECPCDK